MNKGVTIVKNNDLPAKSVSTPQLKTTTITTTASSQTQNRDELFFSKQIEPIAEPSVPNQDNTTTTPIEINQNGTASPRVFTRKINIEKQSSPKVSISDADVDQLIDEVLEKQKENEPEEEVSIVYKPPSLGTLRLNTGASPTSEPNPPVSVTMTTLSPNNTVQNTTSTSIASNNVVSIAVPVITSGPARVLGYANIFSFNIILHQLFAIIFT